MTAFNRKQHWDNIYQTKGDKEVSWYQEKPETALTFFNHFNIPKKANIIDIGGGNREMSEGELLQIEKQYNRHRWRQQSSG